MSIKNKETKVLVSFFLLYLGISGLPAVMSLSAFARPNVVSQVGSIDGGGTDRVRVPFPATQNMAALPPNHIVTPTASSASATPKLTGGVVVSTKSQIQVGKQTNMIEVGALFRPINRPSRMRSRPSAASIVVVPTRVPQVTPTRSVKAVPTLVPEPKVTATPPPLPTSVVPVNTTPIVLPTAVAGQSILPGQ